MTESEICDGFVDLKLVLADVINDDSISASLLCRVESDSLTASDKKILDDTFKKMRHPVAVDHA